MFLDDMLGSSVLCRKGPSTALCVASEDLVNALVVHHIVKVGSPKMFGAIREQAAITIVSHGCADLVVFSTSL